MVLFQMITQEVFLGMARQHGRPKSPTFEALGDQQVMDPGSSEAPTPNPRAGSSFLGPQTFAFLRRFVGHSISKFCGWVNMKNVLQSDPPLELDDIHTSSQIKQNLKTVGPLAAQCLTHSQKTQLGSVPKLCL